MVELSPRIIAHYDQAQAFGRERLEEYVQQIQQIRRSRDEVEVLTIMILFTQAMRKDSAAVIAALALIELANVGWHRGWSPQ